MDLSFCCWESPCPGRDHRRCKKAKMMDEETMMMVMTAMKRMSANSMLRVVKSRVTTVAR
jgi:hypothetical protein